MGQKKQSRYSYSKGEMEINRAFKMQEKELTELAENSEQLKHQIEDNQKSIDQNLSDIQDLHSQIEQLKRKALSIASRRGLNVPKNLSEPAKKPVIKPIVNDTTPYLADEKIPMSAIPSWDEVMRKTNNIIPEDVVLEDLLSQSEFNYAIEDVKRINKEFAEKTKINKTDIIFLMIASALQTSRWIIIRLLMGELGETINSDKRISSYEGDHQKKQDTHKWNDKHDDHKNVNSEKYPTWKDIIFGQYKREDGGKSSGVCPYDAQHDAPNGFDDGGKGSHRVNTLGHDPVLGWIFGTANLMTCTISLSKRFGFGTYRVLYPGGRFGNRIPMPMMFAEVLESTKEDKFRLAAGLFAQYAHLKSDEFTSRGLPVPLIEAFSEELAGKLYSEQYDALCLVKDLKKVGMQAGISILINMVISFVHGLFYNKDKDGDRDHYEVRTRKILLFSNLISSGLNLAWVGGNAAYGNETAWKDLDLGGLLVSIWRLFSDVRFITKVKEEFINQEMDKATKQALADLDSMFEE